MLLSNHLADEMLGLCRGAILQAEVPFAEYLSLAEYIGITQGRRDWRESRAASSGGVAAMYIGKNRVQIRIQRLVNWLLISLYSY
jgi:hypothetical protein